MSKFCCSNCFQRGTTDFKATDNGSMYSTLQEYSNNTNNEPIHLPFPYPPLPNPQGSRPYDAPDYYQNYMVTSHIPASGYGNLRFSYPMPPGCNRNLNFSNLNPWTINDVKKILKQKTPNEKILNQLVHCLNQNYVFKFNPNIRFEVEHYVKEIEKECQ